MATEARKRAWTKYNKSDKKKEARRRYYLAHKEEIFESNKHWFENNPDKTRAYRRNSQKKRRENGKDSAYKELINKQNPLFFKAHDIANNAVKSGKIKRKLNCEHCGTEGLIHKHHSDYSKPLEVIWLCPKCHKKADKCLLEMG